MKIVVNLLKKKGIIDNKKGIFDGIFYDPRKNDDDDIDRISKKVREKRKNEKKH